MTSSNVIELAEVVPHRSVSQLTTYTACSEQFRLQRVAKAPQQPAAWFIHGSGFHHAIEEYELSGRQMTVEQARQSAYDYYDTEIAKELEKEPDYTRWMTGGAKKGETDIIDRREKMADQVGIYINYAEAHDDEWRIAQFGPRGVAVELEFNIQFGPVMVKGFIDQVREYRDGRLVPVDLKSGSREPASGFQLAVYAHAINEYLNVLPPGGAFFMPKLKRSGGLVGDVWKDLTPFSRELLDEMFDNFDKAERAGIYIPNPSDSCRTCSVAEFCRVKGAPQKIPLFSGIKTRQEALAHTSG